jgi:hypothetical protein
MSCDCREDRNQTRVAAVESRRELWNERRGESDIGRRESERLNDARINRAGGQRGDLGRRRGGVAAGDDDFANGVYNTNYGYNGQYQAWNGINNQCNAEYAGQFGSSDLQSETYNAQGEIMFDANNADMVEFLQDVYVAEYMAAYDNARVGAVQQYMGQLAQIADHMDYDANTNTYTANNIVYFGEYNMIYDANTEVFTDGINTIDLNDMAYYDANGIVDDMRKKVEAKLQAAKAAAGKLAAQAQSGLGGLAEKAKAAGSALAAQAQQAAAAAASNVKQLAAGFDPAKTLTQAANSVAGMVPTKTLTSLIPGAGGTFRLG